MRRGGRQKPQRSDQHGHHDGAKSQHGAFDRGLFNGVPAHAQLVDVLQHDDPGLAPGRDAEKGKKANSRKKRWKLVCENKQR